MSVRVPIKESLEASVEFWGVGDVRNVKSADAPKLRYFDVHPTKPLILAADREGKVVLWDYNLKKTLLSSHVSSLIIDRANQSDGSRGPINLPISSNRSTNSSSAAIAGNLAGRTLSGNMTPLSPSQNIELVSTLSASLSPAVLNKIKQQIGQINQVSFADVSYMLSQAGLGGRNYNHFLHNSNSETLIAIVCDSVVVFHDYLTNETTSVGSAELSKSTPTSIELAFVNTCLIGCSDGVIRMWDWTYSQGIQQNTSNTTSTLGLAPSAKGAVVMAMQTHSKSEVVVVKALHVRNPAVVSQYPDQHRVRFVSICADGQALIWDIPALREGYTPLPSGDLVAHSVLPVARLRDSLGPSITRQSISFDAETNILHTCSSERRIRLWDIEEIYSGKRSSLNGSMHGSVHGGSVQGSVHGGAFNASSHGGVSASTHGGKGIGGIRSAMSKRSSISSISSLITGAVDPLANVLSLKTLGAMAPHKSLHATYGKIAAFGVVQHPYFTSGCYVVNSRGNTFAILQDKGSTGANDEVDSTESASTGGSSNEKAAPLALLHEFSLTTLMERFLVEKTAALDSYLLTSLTDALRAEAVDPATRIFAVRPHPSHPSLFAVLSSVGLLMVSVGRTPAGPMYGGHPSWGTVRVAFANDYSVQKVLLAAPEQEDGEAEALPAGEIYLEVLEDGFAVEQTATSPGGAPTPAPVSSSFSLKRKSRKLNLGSSGETKSSCRPVFHVSPSGTYCAVHWSESMVYVVVRVNVAFAAVVQVGSFAVPAEETARPLSTQSAQEVDRGLCLEFGWIGSEDHFIIKTPAEIVARAAGMKAKRGSVVNMFAATRKESSLLLAPQLVLKQCVSQVGQGTGKTTTKIVEHVLQLPGSAAAKSSTAGARETPHVSASTVVNLFGGPVLNINTLNAKEAEAVLTAAALAKRQAEASAAAAAGVEGKRGPAGPPQPAADIDDDGSRMIDDVEATTRELRAAQPPIASKQISSFYTLVSAKWLKIKLAQEAAAVKDKTQKKGKKSSSGAADSTISTDDASSDSVTDSALQLIAVGPSMLHAEMVRWDFQRGLCALVLSGSSAINILRLEVATSEVDGGYPRLDLHTLVCVDFCVPSSIRVSALCGLTWADGVLFATEESAPSVRAVYCSKAHTAAVSGVHSAVHAATTFSLPNFSPVRTLFYLSGFHAASVGNKFNSVPVTSAVPVCEVLGVLQGTVYTASRDGTVFGTPVSVNTELASALNRNLVLAADSAAGKTGLPAHLPVQAMGWLEALSQ